jgi:hypothetical protein
MKKILIAFVTLLALPTAAFAATYHYVDNNGTIQTVTASNAAEAEAKAVNRDPNSGVALDTGVLDTGDGTVGNGNNGYVKFYYVDQMNIVRGIVAATSQEAFAIAANIAPHSGVAQGAGYLEEGVSVNNQ